MFIRHAWWAPDCKISQNSIMPSSGLLVYLHIVAFTQKGLFQGLFLNNYKARVGYSEKIMGPMLLQCLELVKPVWSLNARKHSTFIFKFFEMQGSITLMLIQTPSISTWCEQCNLLFQHSEQKSYSFPKNRQLQCCLPHLKDITLWQTKCFLYVSSENTDVHGQKWFYENDKGLIWATASKPKSQASLVGLHFCSSSIIGQRHGETRNWSINHMT